MNKTQEMFNLVESWKDSGLSRSAFCEQEGITVFKFNYWAAKKRKAELTPGGFTRLDPPASASAYEILYPNGVRLSVKSADLGTLSQLLKL